MPDHRPNKQFFLTFMYLNTSAKFDLAMLTKERLIIN